ncbi:MAG: class I SAM-dependent methyltransferase, partial [Bacillota bacterium]|nr:class I SAM-dependent methyltransferase [Bacillota bacterium]
MTLNIWNFWAKRYDKLWVQKYSLNPTRNCISKIIEQDCKEDENLKVLDLGCGPGQLINILEKKYNKFKITGIDFSEEMLRISKLRNPKTKHIQLNAENLDKLKDKYNIIICTHSLPYYKNLDKITLELFRLLSDNGKIYISFASGNKFYDKLALFFVKLTTGPAHYP